MSDTLFASVTSTGQSMIQRAQALLPQKAPMVNLVTKLDIPKGKTQADLPYVSSIATVDSPAEGDEILNAQQFTISSISIAPGLKSIKFRLSDRAERFSQEQLVTLVSDEMARAEAQNIDELLLNQITNFHTDNDTGTTNVDLIFATLRTTKRKLMATTPLNGGPPEDINFVMSPIAWEDLMTNMGAQGVVGSTAPWIPQGMSADIMKNFAIPGGNLLGGVGLFWDGYMQGTLVNGSGDTFGGMFARKGMYLVMAKDWTQKTYDESSWIGVIIRADADYGAGVGPMSHWGAQVTCDDA